MNLKVSDAKREEGFTLIELLVVVIIIGILAAIAIPVFLNQRERAWIGTAESDARNAAIEVETLGTREGTYPAPAAASDLSDGTLGDIAASAGVRIYYDVDNAAADGPVFQLCAEHEQADGSVVYDSSANGLQLWDDANACAANGDFGGAAAAAELVISNFA